jgi:spermidine synthase
VQTSSHKAEPMLKRKAGIFFAALIVAVGGLIYELIISTASSYLAGDSVLQFSLTIGLMLFGMGIGSWIAPSLKSPPEEKFILVEALLALIGGSSVALLFFSYSYTEVYYLVFVALALLIGLLIGLEIPLMLKIVESKTQMVKITSRILSLDYLGALIASVLYPLVLLPTLGVLRTALLVGLLNCVLAIFIYFAFLQQVQLRKRIATLLIFVFVALLSGFVYAERLTLHFDQKLYQDEVIFQQQTKYQKLVITRFGDDTRLYIDGNIQFSSIDEHRYHEPLVHIPLNLAAQKNRVLILGGGDGLAAREVLRYEQVERIDLVDLDGEMTRLAATHPDLVRLNQGSLSNPLVQVHTADALNYLEENSQLYDVIIIDLPDPNNEGIAKLYSREFYRLAARRLSEGGVLVTQATSPYFSNKAFWMIEHTMTEAGLSTLPYHLLVPSFGEWGFVAAARRPLSPAQLTIPLPTQVLHPDVIPTLFVFDPDMAAPEQVEINTLFEPKIIEVYQEDAKRWQY